MPSDRRAEISEDIVRELQATIQPVAAPPRLRQVDVWAHAYQRRVIAPEKPRHNWRDLVGLAPWFLGAAVVIVGLLSISQYGSGVKGRVVQQGNAAIGYLMDAKDSLERMDIDRAKTNLAQAHAEFDSASRELDALGPALVGMLARIPGLSSLKTGQDILNAGRKLSDAGIALGEALDVLGRSSGIMDTDATNRTSLGQIFLPLQNALTRADDAISEAAELVDGINPDALPEKEREQFLLLRERLPVVQSLIDRTVSAVSFLSRLTGTDQPRRYLVLFANSSELRPTGGFPGSYGLLTFENGRVKDFRADDVYNPDGQIHELIVPPQQLQHITPSWGMRDAAWWADFPTSAKKVMQYWQKGGGAAVDGVLSIKPDILAGILKITGPISLPAYNMVLTSDNVLATLQLEVESKKDAAQPKQVIVDLAPKILERLASAPASQWVALLGLFKDGMDARDILMYFNDQQLQHFVASEGFDGAVKQTDGDYLMVNISNIKGAKTDAVTDTNIKLESWMERGTLVHRLTLTRQHNGGTSEYGFYNKTNYSWVRVLVPDGSSLRGITGNDRPNNQPLLDYARERTAIRDSDLVALENTGRRDEMRDVTTYQESGKTEFGFWMKIEPGQTRAVQIEYAVPARAAASDYRLYVQKQPGLKVGDFEFTLQKNAGISVAESQPDLKEWPDSWRLHSQLQRDLDLSIKM